MYRAPTCRNMVTNETHPIPTNISENTEVLSLMTSSGSINTCEGEREELVGCSGRLLERSLPVDGVKALTVMILEKTMANTGCIAPLMAAQMIPTKMYGHSELLRRSTVRNDTGGAASSS